VGEAGRYKFGKQIERTSVSMVDYPGKGVYSGSRDFFKFC